MQLLLEEICQNIRNYFCDYSKGDVCAGEFEIIENTIRGVNGTKTPAIYSGVYYRIVGSRINSGIFLAGTDTLKDEEAFDGEIWMLRLPVAFLALVEEIKAWQTKNGGVNSENMSPYTSESFGGYSYSKGGSNSSGGTAVSWAAQFGSRLNAWRKI